MRVMRCLTGLACLFLFAVVARAGAPDPLRFVPKQADFFIEVKNPRRLVETGLSLDLVKALYALPPVRDAYDSTTFRRFYQLLAHFETRLGASWPELLDRLAGGGMVVSGKFGMDPAPALLVIQGTDAGAMKKFFVEAVEILQGELLRQESKETVERKTYQGCEAVRVGKDFHAALAGMALFISNKGEALKLALDLHASGPENSLAPSEKVAAAGKLLPPDPLIRLYADLTAAHQSQQGKEIFASPRNDPILTTVFGGLLNTIGRAGFVTAGLHQEKNGFLATVRLPAGHRGAGADYVLHVPPQNGPGSLPLLEPRGVVFSTSFYLDLSKFWEDRSRLLSEQNAKNLEQFDSQTGPVLVGSRLSQLLTQAGARHRFVAANQTKVGYKTTPQQLLPAFAFVTEMRKPDELAKSLDAILRGAALLVGNQFKLKLVEEKHQGRQIVGYRFPEDVPVAQDAEKVRFNFSPCFVRVGNQMAFCSTLEFAREIIDLLEKEAKAPVTRDKAAAVRARLYSAGGAAALLQAEDQVLSQVVLGQAVTLAEAREQFKTLVDLSRRLGILQGESIYEAERLRFDIRLNLGK